MRCGTTPFKEVTLAEVFGGQVLSEGPYLSGMRVMAFSRLVVAAAPT
jgi:hypothetical protein